MTIINLSDNTIKPPSNNENEIYLIADGTPNGYQTIYQWLNDNYTEGKVYRRLIVPYTLRSSTPAHYFLNKFDLEAEDDDGPVIGRIKFLERSSTYTPTWSDPIQVDLNVNEEKVKFEWPFIYPGEVMENIIGNALCGNWIFTYPKISNGFNEIQEFILRYFKDGDTIHGLAAMCLSRLDVNFPLCLMEVSRLFPTNPCALLPLTEKHISRSSLLYDEDTVDSYLLQRYEGREAREEREAHEEEERRRAGRKSRRAMYPMTNTTIIYHEGVVGGYLTHLGKTQIDDDDYDKKTFDLYQARLFEMKKKKISYNERKRRYDKRTRKRIY